MMRNAATYVIAFALGALALDAFQQVPTAPPWVDEICEPASPCSLPTEVYQAVQLSIDWLEADGVTPCPEPAVDQHPQDPCGPDPQIRQWVALTRGDVAWGDDAIDHDVLVSEGPIYSGGSSPIGIAEYSGFGHSGAYARGLVVTFRLPASALQIPSPPTIDPQGWSDWWDIKMAQCAAGEAACAPLQGGGIDQATFDTMLATSPFATAVHSLNLTVNGQQITGTTGPPQ